MPQRNIHVPRPEALFNEYSVDPRRLFGPNKNLPQGRQIYNNHGHRVPPKPKFKPRRNYPTADSIYFNSLIMSTIAHQQLELRSARAPHADPTIRPFRDCLPCTSSVWPRLRLRRLQLAPRNTRLAWRRSSVRRRLPHAVHQHPTHADGQFVRRAKGRAVRDGRRIEHHDVRPQAALQHAAIGEPHALRRQRGELADGLLER